MGALPRHPHKEKRRLPNAERNTALVLWCFTVPAGWKALRFYAKGGGRVGR